MSGVPGIKALFFDLDGTLISPHTHHIPDSVIAALQRADAQGYLLFVATGRNARETAQVEQLAQIPFRGHVLMTGQLCLCGNQVIHKNPLPKKDIETLLAYLQAHPYPCLFSEGDDAFINYVDALVLEMDELIHVPPPKVRDVRRALERDILQLGLYLPKGGAIPPVVEQMTGCRWTRWHTSGIDILPKDGGKWQGILRMAEHFGFAPGEVMAFGDNDNDIEMLQKAGYSVAMGNGTPEARAAARYVAAALEDDGVAKAMQHLLGV